MQATSRVDTQLQHQGPTGSTEAYIVVRPRSKPTQATSRVDTQRQHQGPTGSMEAYMVVYMGECIQR